MPRYIDTGVLPIDLHGREVHSGEFSPWFHGLFTSNLNILGRGVLGDVVIVSLDSKSYFTFVVLINLHMKVLMVNRMEKYIEL